MQISPGSVDAAASAVADVAQSVADDSGSEAAVEEGAGQTALGWLEVFLEGFGPEFCDPQQDADCGT